MPHAAYPGALATDDRVAADARRRRAADRFPPGAREKARLSRLANSARRRAPLLAALAAGHSLRRAIIVADLTDQTVLRWRRGDPLFAAAVDAARAAGRATRPRRVPRLWRPADRLCVKAAFLDALAGGAALTRALAAVGLCADSVLDWRRREPKFDAAVIRALAAGAWRRDYVGWWSACVLARVGRRHPGRIALPPATARALRDIVAAVRRSAGGG